MYDSYIKNKVIKEYKNGKSIINISKEFYIPYSTISDWIKKENIDKPIKKKTFKELERIIYLYQNIHCHIYSTTAEKENAIKEFLTNNPEYKIKEVCKLLKLPHGTYYNFINRKVEVKQQNIIDKTLKNNIKEIFEISKGRLGPKKIYIKLKERGIKTSIKKVSTLMKELGLTVLYAKRKYVKPKQTSNTFLRNILKRNFIQNEPNKVWVSDFTEIKVQGIPYYLCVILDLFSRKVIAYRAHYQKNTNLLINTFKDAFRIRNEPQDLLFHSDQGGEYVSNDFQNLLATLHVRQSVSQPGMPYDNAVIESFYSIIKREEIYKNNYQDYNHLKESIADYINFYNNYRPHRTLNNLTPNEYEIRYFQNINIEN